MVRISIGKRRKKSSSSSSSSSQNFTPQPTMSTPEGPAVESPSGNIVVVKPTRRGGGGGGGRGGGGRSGGSSGGSSPAPVQTPQPTMSTPQGPAVETSTGQIQTVGRTPGAGASGQVVGGNQLDLTEQQARTQDVSARVFNEAQGITSAPSNQFPRQGVVLPGPSPITTFVGEQSTRFTGLTALGASAGALFDFGTLGSRLRGDDPFEEVFEPFDNLKTTAFFRPEDKPDVQTGGTLFTTGRGTQITESSSAPIQFQSSTGLSDAEFAIQQRVIAGEPLSDIRLTPAAKAAQVSEQIVAEITPEFQAKVNAGLSEEEAQEQFQARASELFDERFSEFSERRGKTQEIVTDFEQSQKKGAKIQAGAEIGATILAFNPITGPVTGPIASSALIGRANTRLIDTTLTFDDLTLGEKANRAFLIGTDLAVGGAILRGSIGTQVKPLTGLTDEGFKFSFTNPQGKPILTESSILGRQINKGTVDDIIAARTTLISEKPTGDFFKFTDFDDGVKIVSASDELGGQAFRFKGGSKTLGGSQKVDFQGIAIPVSDSKVALQRGNLATETTFRTATGDIVTVRQLDKVFSRQPLTVTRADLSLEQGGLTASGDGGIGLSGKLFREDLTTGSLKSFEFTSVGLEGQGALAGRTFAEKGIFTGVSRRVVNPSVDDIVFTSRKPTSKLIDPVISRPFSPGGKVNTVVDIKLDRGIIGRRGKIDTVVIEKPKITADFGNTFKGFQIIQKGKGFTDTSIFGKLDVSARANTITTINRRGFRGATTLTQETPSGLVTLDNNLIKALGAGASKPTQPVISVKSSLVGPGAFAALRQQPSQFAGTGQFERTSGGLLPGRFDFKAETKSLTNFKPSISVAPTLLNPTKESFKPRTGVGSSSINVPRIDESLRLGNLQAEKLITEPPTDLITQPVFGPPRGPRGGPGFGGGFRFPLGGLLPPPPLFVEGPSRRRVGKRGFKRRPTLLAAELDITSPEPFRGEITGLGTRPILKKKKKKRK